MLWRGGKATRSPRGTHRRGKGALGEGLPLTLRPAPEISVYLPLSLSISALSSGSALQWGRGGGGSGWRWASDPGCWVGPAAGGGGRPEAASAGTPVCVNVAVCCGTASQHCESSGPPPPASHVRAGLRDTGGGLGGRQRAGVEGWGWGSAMPGAGQAGRGAGVLARRGPAGWARSPEAEVGRTGLGQDGVRTGGGWTKGGEARAGRRVRTHRAHSQDATFPISALILTQGKASHFNGHGWHGTPPSLFQALPSLKASGSKPPESQTKMTSDRQETSYCLLPK